MKISEKTFVAIEYRLTLESGEEVDRSPEGQPLGFITGTGQIIPGLESALIGKASGGRELVTVEPEEGYGPVDENLFRDIPRSRFPEDAKIEPGSMFRSQGPRGPMVVTVAKVGEDTVTVDLNHPLAGKRLFFDVAIIEVREPHADEISRLSGGCSCGPAEQEGCGCGPDQQAGCGSGCACG